MQVHNLGGALNGIQIIAVPHMEEKKVAHMQERKWARRVMYQRARRFDYTYADMVVRMGDQLFAHPAVIERIKSAAEKAGRE